MILNAVLVNTPLTVVSATCIYFRFFFRDLDGPKLLGMMKYMHIELIS